MPPFLVRFLKDCAWAVFGLLLLFMFCYSVLKMGKLLGESRAMAAIETVATKTDTVYIQHHHTDTVRILVPTVATTRFIYLADTLRRQRLERGTLVAGVAMQNSMLEIETISPKGITELATYPIPPHAKIDIDAMGYASVATDPQAAERAARKERRARRWRRTTLVATAIGGGAAVLLLQAVSR